MHCIKFIFLLTSACFMFFTNSTLLYSSSKIFSYMDKCSHSQDISSCNIITFYVFILTYYLQWCSSLILLSRDIKTNPGPTPSSIQCFSIYHWNLNSITAYIFVKLSFLTSYNLVHSFDIICLSEINLNSETLLNDKSEIARL